MTQEEKAKAYDEALKRAKNLENTTTEEDALIKYIFSEPVEDEDEKIRKAALEGIEYLEHELCWDAIGDIDILDVKLYLEKQKDASKAIEAVDRIDKYIDSHTANAHDMDDSHPDKKYYSGVDDTLCGIAGILEDVYSGEKQKDIESKYDGMVVVSQEEWDTAIADAFKHGMDEGEKQKEQNPTECDKETDIQKAFREGQWAGRQEVFDHPEEYGLLQKPRKFKLGDKVYWHDGDADVVTITGFRDDAYLTDSAYGPILFCDEDNWDRVEQKPVEESGTVEPDYGICDDYIPASLHHALKRHGWYATHVGENPDKEVIKYVEATMDQKPTEKSSMLKILKEHLANTTREQLDAEFEALKDLTINKPAECSEDERIRKEINILYADIDDCITALLKARMDKDSEAEGKALFKMEGLMVATLQVITCIEDYLEKQK